MEIRENTEKGETLYPPWCYVPRTKTKNKFYTPWAFGILKTTNVVELREHIQKVLLPLMIRQEEYRNSGFGRVLLFTENEADNPLQVMEELKQIAHDWVIIKDDKNDCTIDFVSYGHSTQVVSWEYQKQLRKLPLLEGRDVVTAADRHAVFVKFRNIYQDLHSSIKRELERLLFLHDILLPVRPHQGPGSP